MARILQLYQLQTIDIEIDQLNQELAEVKANLGESAALKAARDAVEIVETSLRKAQTGMQDLDLEVKSLANKISRQEKNLYSGRVLNAKEAANLQEEVASLRRRHSEREERLLEAMLEVEEAEEMVTAARAQLATVQANWETNQEELQQAQHRLTSRLAELQERRPAVAQSVADEDLAEYERLRPKKGGRAVVTVKNGVCQGCGVTPSYSRIQRARGGVKLIDCDACGRILYVP